MYQNRVGAGDALNRCRFERCVDWWSVTSQVDALLDEGLESLGRLNLIVGHTLNVQAVLGRHVLEYQ